MITADTILKSMVITEKATLLSTHHNQYTFKVSATANRRSVAQAIEKTFNVEVTAVRILNVKPQPVRTRRGKRGYKPCYKKAIVSLKTGDKIEIL